MIKFKNLSKEEKEIYTKMEQISFSLDKDLGGLRTGRASPGLIDRLHVDAHGVKTSIYQIANISIANNQTLSVKLWDKSLIKRVEKAIIDANLGVAVSSEDNIVSVTLPILTEERRKELVKLGMKYLEKVKITLRAARTEYLHLIKAKEKDKIISKDEAFTKSKTLQNILDHFIKEVDLKLENKSKDIMKI